MLKLGYMVSSEQCAQRELLDCTVLAEQCGFVSAWISDHFQPWRHTGGHAPHSLVSLGAPALLPDETMNAEDPLEMEKLADALPVERAASRRIVSDDADEIVERIGDYVALGFGHLMRHAPGPDQARFLKLFSEQVVPKLRAKYGYGALMQIVIVGAGRMGGKMALRMLPA